MGTRNAEEQGRVAQQRRELKHAERQREAVQRYYRTGARFVGQNRKTRRAFASWARSAKGKAALAKRSNQGKNAFDVFAAIKWGGA